MKKCFLALFSAALILGGCSKDDENTNPDSGEIINPGTEVPDPNGTVQLSMRNGDDTSLDGLYIGKDDNFHGNGWMIASLGKVKGLGNVSDIPLAGWASRVAVVPGQGYVAHNEYSDEYVRIYVIEYIASATTGGVIGAEVKYQKPFKGLDQSVEVDMTSVVLPSEGASQQVSFSNSCMIPFKVESSADWCHVQKASTRDYNFLYDAVLISCEESYSGKAANATVTITNLYGKATEIQVTREARGEFVQLSQNELHFSFSNNEQYKNINVFTNIEPQDIKVETNADWISAQLSNSAYDSPRKVRYVEGITLTRAMLDNPISRNLEITVQPNFGADMRSGVITLSYGQIEAVLTVSQDGSSFNVDKTNFEFEANNNLSTETTLRGNIQFNSLKFEKVGEKNTDWCTVSNNWQRLTITVEPNPYETARSMIVKIMYNNQELGQLNITQKGMKYEDQYVYFEKNSSNISLTFPLLEDSKITSTADWCTATPSGSSLVIRATATTENRAAVISVSGVSAKIYVSQSKYAVNDEYSEGGVEGIVYKMENGIGRIYQTIKNFYAWSIENVDIAGAKSWDDGMANTEAIKMIPDWKNLYPAFAACDALNKDGVTGWYMPAKNESPMTYMSIDSYTKGIWSSTSVNDWDAINTNGNSRRKSEQLCLTPVHQFNYDFNKK